MSRKINVKGLSHRLRLSFDSERGVSVASEESGSARQPACGHLGQENHVRWIIR